MVTRLGITTMLIAPGGRYSGFTSMISLGGLLSSQERRRCLILVCRKFYSCSIMTEFVGRV